jgi:hypothetical protein
MKAEKAIQVRDERPGGPLTITQRDVQTLIARFVGQANVLTIPREFIRWTGDIEAALLLSQLLYWSERTSDPDGWIYKSAREWEEEIGISTYSLRKARKALEPFGVESVVRTQNNVPTVHYRINQDQFYKCILRILQMHSSISQNAFGENAKTTYTETTAETNNIDISSEKPAATQERPVNPVPKKPARAPAVETPLPADFTVTADMLTWAKERGIPPVIITRETEKFINTATAKGYVYKNWVAAWRTWMLRIEDFSPNNGNGRHEPTGRVIHEATAEERAERERRRNMPVAPPRRPAA